MRWAMAESGRMRALMGPVCRCGQDLFDRLVRCLRYNRRIAVSPYRRIAVSPYRRIAVSPYRRIAVIGGGFRI